MLTAGFKTTSRLLLCAAYLLNWIAEQEPVRKDIEAFPTECVARLEDLSNRPRLRQTQADGFRKTWGVGLSIGPPLDLGS
jgi:hypothetical protein